MRNYKRLKQFENLFVASIDGKTKTLSLARSQKDMNINFKTSIGHGVKVSSIDNLPVHIQLLNLEPKFKPLMIRMHQNDYKFRIKIKNRYNAWNDIK